VTAKRKVAAAIAGAVPDLALTPAAHAAESSEESHSRWTLRCCTGPTVSRPAYQAKEKKRLPI
jgi:ABC-type nitrate/sulfonate/bicarbonate transport system substrate-binding protein